MTIVELHIIQSFPVTCLNRDDIGSPKTAVFGGASRARVSSQCWKRAIRETAAGIMPESFAGKRSHYFREQFRTALESQSISEDLASKLAAAIADYCGSPDAKNTEKTKVALYLSPEEVNRIALGLADEYRDNDAVDAKKMKTSIKNALKNSVIADLADIAIFGRMVANDPSLSLEGAGMFSHALSTHSVSNEIDFFSAVDDLKPEDTEGAGHIGTLEFNSACYYRYIGLNTDLLSDTEHLGGLTAGEREKIMETFLRACILAVPGARRNSMNGSTLPAHIIGTVRTGSPLSLVNAFEKPVRSSGGYIENSVDAMEKHYTRLTQTYGIETLVECRMPEIPLPEFLGRLVGHV